MKSLSSSSTKLAAVVIAVGSVLAAVATATAWSGANVNPPPAATPSETLVAAPIPRAEPEAKGFLDQKESVYSVSYAPDGKRFLSVGNGHAIVWDSGTLQKLYTVDAEFAEFSGDGKSLFVLVKDRFRTHDAATGKETASKKRQMPRPVYPGRTAAFSKTAQMWTEFDGVRHHLRTELTDDLYDFADQYELGLTGGFHNVVYGRGGAFSPDSARFAGIHRMLKDANGTQGVLSIWQTKDGKRVGTIARDANHPVRAFAWSPDGKEIAVVYADGVRVHDSATLQEARTFDTKYGTAVAWSKDGKQLALASAVEVQLPNPVPGTFGPSTIAVQLLDARTGKELRRVEGFPDNLPVVSLAFSPDGTHLLTGAGFFPDDAPAANVPLPAKDARALRVLPVNAPVKPAGPVAWKETKVLGLAGWISGSVVYSTDGKTLFVGGTNSHVRAYDTTSWKLLWEYECPTTCPTLAVSPDGKNVAVTFKDADRRWGVRLLNAKTGKLEYSLEEGGVPGVVAGPEPYGVGFFPNVTLLDAQSSTSHKLIFGTAGKYVVKTWVDPEKASTITTSTVAEGKLPADTYAVPLAVDPEGKRVVVKGPIDGKTGKNVFWAWSAGSGAANKLLEGHKDTVVCAAWSKNGKVIVTGDAGGEVIVWDAATFKEKSRVTLGGRVVAVAVSPDGMGIAASAIRPNTAPLPGQAGCTGDVFTWLAAFPPKKPEPLSSTQTGSPFSGVASLAFSPDGKSLASTFANFTLLTRFGILVGQVRVFSVVPVEPEKPAPTSKNVTDVSFSSDGKKFLAVVGGKIEVSDTATGKQLYALAGESARFSPDSKTLFVMADKVLECDAATGKTLKSHDRPKTKFAWTQVAFSPDGKQFAVHFGPHARVYDTATGHEVKLEKVIDPVGGYRIGSAAPELRWSPDGKAIIAGGVLVAEGRTGAAVWEVASGRRRFVFNATEERPTGAAAFERGWGKVAVASGELVELWVLEAEAKKNPERKYHAAGPVTAVAFSKDGKLLAVGARLPILNPADKPPSVVGYKSIVQVFSATSAEELKRLDGFEGVDHMAPTKLPVTALAFSPDGKKLLAGTGATLTDLGGADLAPQAGEVKLFDLTEQPAPAAQKWTDTSVLDDHGSLVNGVAVAPDGKSFAAATASNVTCWDMVTRKKLWAFKPGRANLPTLALAYSPDGKHLCVAGQIDVMRLDAKTGKEEPWTADNAVWFGKVGAIAYPPDGKRLAASDGYVTRVRTLDAKGEAVTLGTPPMQFRPAPEKPAGLAWSKDGRWLALIHAHQDGKKYPVTLWEVDGKAPHTKSLLGHDDPVLAVAWSEDGKLIASGDEKGTVILWDAATGKELWRKKFTGRDETDGRINALAFSPADNTLAAAVSMGSGKGPERIVVLAPESGKDVAHLMRPWHVPVASVAWGKNGKILVTGCGAAGGGIKQTEPVVGEVVVWERQP